MSDSSPLTTGEFVRTMNAFGERIDKLTEQVTITNGRVMVLERGSAVEAEKVETLRRDMGHLRKHRAPVTPGAATATAGESTPITRRDLSVAVFAIAALFAAIRWLPALFQAAQGAP